MFITKDAEIIKSAEMRVEFDPEAMKNEELGNQNKLAQKFRTLEIEIEE
jgi:hypothetical protein